MTEIERIVEAATRLVEASTHEEFEHAFAELCDELGADTDHFRYQFGEIL